MTIKILIIAGTRPELIKLSPLIKLIQKEREFEFLFIFSGQHYDYNLFMKFLIDLELPAPNFNIKVGSGTHGYQVGTIVCEIEKIVQEFNPDVVIAEGDTNTVLASALATRKLNKCFMHLEAGIRSFDEKMPEEINRIITGVCSMFHLAPTEQAAINLLYEGTLPEKIFVVGNTIVDAVYEVKKMVSSKSQILNSLNFDKTSPLVLVTLHRPSNVDNVEKIKSIVHTLTSLNNFNFIFPIHPRTRKNLETFGLLEKLIEQSHILVIDPVGYLDMIEILSNSLCILTDSGGIQEEACILRIPCLTLRNNTERPETIDFGANMLVGNNMQKLVYELNKIEADPKYLKGKSDANPFGDGRASHRIIKVIKNLHEEKQFSLRNTELWEKIPEKKLVNVQTNDINTTVQCYEEKYNVKIQIIFDEEGKPIFPYRKTTLHEGFTLLINVIK